MSGVAVIRYLLAHNAAVLAVVPAARIMAGGLPLGTTLPAISVTQLSSIPRNVVAMDATHVQHTDHVQVTVLFKTPSATPPGDGYPGKSSLLKKVLAACPNRHGAVGSVDVDCIIPEPEGPDISDAEEGMEFGSRDFMVRWNGP